MSSEKQVVVVLPFIKSRVLMQLRDFNSSIDFPGRWGFFGGSIMDKETPEEAARRELFEEIGLHPDTLYKINQTKIEGMDNCFSYAYGCPLTVPPERLVLKEGLDFVLATLEQVLSKTIYSVALKKHFPVIGIPYIPSTISKLLESL